MQIVLLLIVSTSLRSLASAYFMEQYYTIDNNTAPIRSDLNVSSEYRLLKKLTALYNPYVRPVLNSSLPVKIGLGLTLTQILDLDEKNQVLTTNVWMEAEWYDEKLIWKPSEYDFLTMIRIPNDAIWLPDIVLYNSADDYSNGFMPALAMVRYDGHIFWGPVARFRSSCKIDITYFPFDSQVCHLKLGSWAYNGFQVDVTNRSNTMDLSNFVDNGEWELVKIEVVRSSVQYGCCNEPFPDVKFYMLLRRRITYYMMNIIIPCIVLSILCLAGFLLPPESGEKVNLGLSVLLTLTVFMLMVADKMPQTSESISLIGIYLLFVLSSSCLSVLVAVTILSIHHQRGKPRPIPSWITSFGFNLLARFLCVTVKRKPNYRKISQASDDMIVGMASMNATTQHLSETYELLGMEKKALSEHSPLHRNISALTESQKDVLLLIKLLQHRQEEDNEDSETIREWRQVAVVIDRLLFVVFAIFTVSTTAGLLTMRPQDVIIT